MDDILSVILSNLSITDLLSVRLSSKYYNNYVCTKSIKKYIIKLKSDNIYKVCLLNNGIGICNLYYDLYLYNNTKITDKSIKCLPNLTSLNLSCNNTIIDESVKYLINLTSLNLCFNNIITDESVKCLTNLTFLNLSFNTKITDKSVKCLANLTSLDLSFNNIITDECVKNLTNVKVIR